jgi:hypothetical protein
MRALAAAVLLLAGAQALGAVDAGASAGQRLKVSGTWDGSILHATRVQERDASKDAQHGQVEGAIASVDPSTSSMQIGPLAVTWSDATTFDGIDVAALRSGTVVQASGEMRSPMHLEATALEAGSNDVEPDVLEIVGAVNETHGEGASKEVAILGVPVLLPTADGALSALTLRDDDRRPEDQLTVNVHGHPLTIGGEFGASSRYRDNFSLDDTEQLVRADLEAQLEFFYPFAPHAAAFAELRGSSERELYKADGDTGAERALERGEMWVYIDGLWDEHLALQIGRQNIEEDREWWWDADLDAIRLYMQFEPWSMELATARDLGRVSTLGDLEPADQDLSRVLGRVTWRWSERHRAELFFLHQNDRSPGLEPGMTLPEDSVDEEDADLTWIGWRATGKTSSGPAGKFQYWVDTALVRGSEELTSFDTDDNDLATIEELEHRKVRAWAIDLGASWTLPVSFEPTLTLGYAVGSGDDGEGTDHAFRQTGLDNNNTRFRGVDRFRIYGELLQPELSNLGILTASVGMQLGRDRSVELAYHRYRQQEAADELRDARIDADLTGTSRDVGDEFDVIFGFEQWKHLEMELVGAAFRSGDAYGALAGEWAYGFIAKLDYNF